MSNGLPRRSPCRPGPLPSTAAGQWRGAPDGAETAKLHITKSFSCVNITGDPVVALVRVGEMCWGNSGHGLSAVHANVPGREAKPARPQSGGNARRAVLLAQSPTRVSGHAGVIVCIHYAAPPKMWPWLPTRAVLGLRAPRRQLRLPPYRRIPLRRDTRSGGYRSGGYRSGGYRSGGYPRRGPPPRSRWPRPRRHRPRTSRWLLASCPHGAVGPDGPVRVGAAASTIGRRLRPRPPGRCDELEADVARISRLRAASGRAPRAGRTVAECGVPAQPRLDLVQANRQDQTVTRYETFDGLVDYCRLSANPVGRTVLSIFGATSRRPACPTVFAPGSSWSSTGKMWPKTPVGPGVRPAAGHARFGVTEQDSPNP